MRGRSIGVVVALALLVLACGPTPSETPSSARPSGAASPSPSAASPEPSATAVPSGGSTGDGPPRLSLEPIVGSMADPVDIAWRPDDPSTLFVVEQVGRVRISRDDQLVPRPFLDIT
ncbi:MAG TPA: hypothetical protein VF253_09155, partial [Candidatus Limnocylindrales bacterium]